MIRLRLGGTWLCLHFSFFAMLCLYFQIEKEHGGILCLMAALCHEAGHLLAFTAQKAAPRELHFQLGGIRLVPSEKPLSFWGELVTLAAGSAVSFLLGWFFWQTDKGEAALAHLFTGTFSLLPLPGLDGGEIVSLLWLRFFPTRERGCRVTCLIFTAIFSAAAAVMGYIYGSWIGFLAAAGMISAAVLQKS